VEFEELRHPALDLRNGNFIPNDVHLGGNVGKIALLTGKDYDSTLSRLALLLKA
jgi:DNA mismatch repair protein MSH6